MIRKKKELKKILITFDYELSLGIDSGTCDKCIIEPTNLILDFLKKNDSKAVFFVDAMYIHFLKMNNHRDYSKTANQIKRIILNGSNVELHIHPQWLDAYSLHDDRWTFKSFDRYRLHSLNKDEINFIFQNSINTLNEIINDLNKDYKITSFRAGGWCVQPFDILKEFFVKYSIKNDFSVNPGLFNYGKINYDFKNAPKDLSKWSFSNDPLVPEENGIFYEYPVSTFRINNFNLFINNKLKKKNDREYNDGVAINIDNINSNKFIKALKMFSNKFYALSLDGLSFDYYIKALKILNKNNLSFIQTVGHTKKMSANFLKILDYLINNYQTLNIKDLNDIAVVS